MRPNLLVAALLLLTCWNARAEPVRLSIASGGDKSSGHGWLFRDGDFCGVITAAHVAAPSSKPAAVIVHTAGGLEGSADKITILSPEEGGLDVALIAVGGPISAQGCTSSTLGYADLSTILPRIHQGLVETLTPEQEKVTQEVEILAENTGRPVISVRPRNQHDEVVAGFSGSPVTIRPEDRVVPGLGGLPLAMIVRVSGGEAAAIRFDAIHRLAREAIHTNVQSPAKVTSSSGGRLVSWQGVSLSPECPPSAALVTSSVCGWRVTAAQGGRSAALVIAPPSQVLRGVSANISYQAPTNGPRVSIEISANDQGDDWTWVATALIAADGTVMAGFQPVTARRVRLSLPLKPGETAEVGSVGLY